LIGTKELYTGTPNSDIRILCTVLCGRNVNKPSAPTGVEGKGLKLIYQVRANTYGFGKYGKYSSNIFFIPPLGPFSLKDDKFFVLISSHVLQYTDLTHAI